MSDEKLAVTLHLGDCLEYMQQLAPGTVDAVVTDPPYGNGYNTDSRRFTSGNRGHDRGGRKLDIRGIPGDDNTFNPSPFLVFPKVVLWGANHFMRFLPVGTTLVWIKKNEAAYGSFLSDAELAWMKGGYGVYCRKDMSMYGQSRKRMHPTQKPVEIMKWCMDRAKIPVGATVFDPFMGSGTTGVACLQTGRNFIGCEIDEEFFEIAQRRLLEEAERV